MTTIRRWMLAAAGVAVLTACAPGAQAARGIEAIRAFYTQDVAAAQAAGISNVNDPATDVGVSGDLAWETGKFSG